MRQTTNSCLCGCGTAVANRFKAGHDAKLKSQLVNSALQGDDPEAVARLAELGWSQFLDKAKQRKARQALPRSTLRRITAAQQEERAVERVRLLQNMTEAATALRNCGRSPAIQVHRLNWQAILDDPLGYEHGVEQ